MISYTFKKDYTIEVTYDYSPMRKNVFEKTEVEELEGRELDNAIREKGKRLNMESHRRPSLTKKESFVEKTRDYKKLFRKGDSITLNKGVNILVGDNGCGKSSLVNILIKDKLLGRVFFVDMEKSNPTISKPSPEKGVTYSGEEILTHFMWSAESHGETREGVLQGVLQVVKKEKMDFLIIDEPEQGLSLKNQKKYLDELKNTGKNIIIITHSKVFVENVDKVFDVETMKWINTQEYLKEI